VKAADFKVTIDTDKPPTDLTALFADVLRSPGGSHDSASAMPNVIGLHYACGPDVAILLSKNAGRYRIQSASFEALWLVARELVSRLRASLPGVAVQFNEPLPLQEFFDLIDAHLAARKAVAAVAADLEQRAAQFRAVQKRLLVRFKDKNPAPIANLDLIVTGTHAQLMDLADRMEAAQAEQASAAGALSCATQLVCMLMALRFDLDEENAEALRAHLSPLVSSDDDQGWQERTDAALTHALRTSLGKSGKENAGGVGSNALAMPQDTSKLKKHITVLCDRLSKGGRFVNAGAGLQPQTASQAQAQ